MPDPRAIDPTRCPLCGEANQCATEIECATGEPQPPCWCLQATFTEALLARVPQEARYRACICARCAAQALAQKAAGTAPACGA